MFGVYLDIQDITASKLRQPDVLMSTGQIENPTAPLSERRYVMKSIKQESGTLLPTLGIIRKSKCSRISKRKVHFTKRNV